MILKQNLYIFEKYPFFNNKFMIIAIYHDTHIIRDRTMDFYHITSSINYKISKPS